MLKSIINNKLKWILILAVVLALFACASAGAESGTWGSLSWSLSDGVLTITGSGTMDNFTSNDTRGWQNYRNQITSVSIGSGITSIGDYAFYRYTALESVSLPDYIDSIGTQCFSGTNCTLFTYVNTDTAETLSQEDYSFRKPGTNYDLIYLYSGSSIKGLEIRKVDKNIETFDIPTNVNSIGAEAFRDCTQLASITIPDNITKIGSNAFNGCTGLTELEIPNTVSSLGSYALANCSSLMSVSLPGSIGAISEGLLMNCGNLTEITIPSSVITIGGNAFYGCTGLTGIAIPSAVYSIGRSAFDNCSAKRYAALNSDAANALGKAGYSFRTSAESPFEFQYIFSGNTLTDTAICNVDKNTDNMTIPDSVTCIGEDAFRDCANLKVMIIPNKVKTICDNAFNGCSGLENIIINNGLQSIGENAFSGCTQLRKVYYKGSYAEWNSLAKGTGNTCLTGAEIRYCSIYGTCGYKAYWVFDSQKILTVFGSGAMQHCTNQKPWDAITVSFTALIEDGVTTIGDNAFSGKTSLTEITIPASVESIGASAFSGCSNLTDIWFGGSGEQWNAVTKGYRWNYNTPENLTVHFVSGLEPSSREDTWYTGLPDVESGASIRSKATVGQMYLPETAWDENDHNIVWSLNHVSGPDNFELSFDPESENYDPEWNDRYFFAEAAPKGGNLTDGDSVYIMRAVYGGYSYEGTVTIHTVTATLPSGVTYKVYETNETGSVIGDEVPFRDGAFTVTSGQNYYIRGLFDDGLFDSRNQWVNSWFGAGAQLGEYWGGGDIPDKQISLSNTQMFTAGTPGVYHANSFMWKDYSNLEGNFDFLLRVADSNGNVPEPVLLPEYREDIWYTGLPDNNMEEVIYSSRSIGQIWVPDEVRDYDDLDVSWNLIWVSGPDNFELSYEPDSEHYDEEWLDKYFFAEAKPKTDTPVPGESVYRMEASYKGITYEGTLQIDTVSATLPTGVSFRVFETNDAGDVIGDEIFFDGNTLTVKTGQKYYLQGLFDGGSIPYDKQWINSWFDEGADRGERWEGGDIPDEQISRSNTEMFTAGEPGYYSVGSSMTREYSNLEGTYLFQLAVTDENGELPEHDIVNLSEEEYTWYTGLPQNDSDEVIYSTRTIGQTWLPDNKRDYDDFDVTWNLEWISGPDNFELSYEPDSEHYDPEWTDRYFFAEVKPKTDDPTLGDSVYRMTANYKGITYEWTMNIYTVSAVLPSGVTCKVFESDDTGTTLGTEVQFEENDTLIVKTGQNYYIHGLFVGGSIPYGRQWINSWFDDGAERGERWEAGDIQSRQISRSNTEMFTAGEPGYYWAGATMTREYSNLEGNYLFRLIVTDEDGNLPEYPVLRFFEDGRVNVKPILTENNGSFWIDDYMMSLGLDNQYYFLTLTGLSQPEFSWVQTAGPETELGIRGDGEGEVLFLNEFPDQPCELSYELTAEIGEYTATGTVSVLFKTAGMPGTLGFDRVYNMRVGETVQISADFGGDAWTLGNTWKSLYLEEDETGIVSTETVWINGDQDETIGMCQNVAALQPGIVTLAAEASEDGLNWSGTISFIVSDEEGNPPDLPVLCFSENDTNRVNRKPIFTGNDPSYSVDETVMDMDIAALGFYRDLTGERERITWVQTSGSSMDLYIKDDGSLGIIGTRGEPCTLTYEITLTIGSESISTNMTVNFFECEMPTSCGFENSYTLNPGESIELRSDFGGHDWANSEFRGVFVTDDYYDDVVTAESFPYEEGWGYYLKVTANRPGIVSIPVRANQDGMNWDGVIRFVVLNEDGSDPELPTLRFFEDGRENVKPVLSEHNDNFWVDDYMMDLGLENQDYYLRLARVDSPEYCWVQTSGPDVDLEVREDGGGSVLFLKEIPEEACELVYSVTATIGDYSAEGTVSVSFINYRLPDTDNLGFDRAYTLNIGETIFIVANFEGDEWTLGNTWRSIVLENDNSGKVNTKIIQVKDNENQQTGTAVKVTGRSPGFVTLRAEASEDGLNWKGTISFTVLNEDGSYPKPASVSRVLNLPGNLEAVEKEAFANTYAQRININGGCTEIGSRAFADSESLVQLYIPASVNKDDIADDILAGCDNFQVIITPANSGAAEWATKHGYNVIAE